MTRAARQRDPRRAVDQVAHLRGRRGLRDIGAGDVLEHRDQVEFLLILAAERVARLLTDDREHGLMIEQRVVEPRDQVRGARAGGRDADAQARRRIWRRPMP